MNKFTGLVRRCIDDYSMIAQDDIIAVGVSGGKDSVAMLVALSNLNRFYPKRFKIRAITVDMGLPSMDFSPIAELCTNLNVPFDLIHTDLAHIVFDTRNEKNPCALCSKMRRAILNDAAKQAGANKLALAHHHDDAIETFMLSLFYEGRIYNFRPVTYMSRADITQIRPMLYATENDVKNLINRSGLPVVINPCPRNGQSKREEIKSLIQTLSKTYPDLKSKLFGAVKRYPLPGWGKGGTDLKISEIGKK